MGSYHFHHMHSKHSGAVVLTDTQPNGGPAELVLRKCGSSVVLAELHWPSGYHYHSWALERARSSSAGPGVPFVKNRALFFELTI